MHLVADSTTMVLKSGSHGFVKCDPHARTGECFYMEAVEETLSEDQLAAVEAAKKGLSLFITGPAGTGKTKVLSEVITSLPKETTYVTAPTGMAASLLPRGINIHSFMGPTNQSNFQNFDELESTIIDDSAASPGCPHESNTAKNDNSSPVPCNVKSGLNRRGRPCRKRRPNAGRPRGPHSTSAPRLLASVYANQREAYRLHKRTIRARNRLTLRTHRSTDDCSPQTFEPVRREGSVRYFDRMGGSPCKIQGFYGSTSVVLDRYLPFQEIAKIV